MGFILSDDGIRNTGTIAQTGTVAGNLRHLFLAGGLLHTFGTGENWEHWLNLAVGCVVCLLTVAACGIISES